MTDKSGFQEHWLHIEPERMERYETMYKWNPATAHYYANAEIGEGQVVADFGCGPGHAAIEFARQVGETGHVHAFDINEEFVRRARNRASAEGLEKRITVHLLEDSRLPVADRSLDRAVARNTLIYVGDPVFTLAEFRRALRPGGLAHVIEGDWRMTAIEPVPTDEWRAIIDAASWAWTRPEIGRGLYGFARRAGFEEVELQVLTAPDTNGRLKGMVDTVLGYARLSGTLAPERIAHVRKTVEGALAAKTFLAVAPQFVLTARS